MLPCRARGLDDFMIAVKECHKLESFIARGNNLNKDCGHALSKLLCNEGKLMVLDLGCNDLGMMVDFVVNK